MDIDYKPLTDEQIEEAFLPEADWKVGLRAIERAAIENYLAQKGHAYVPDGMKLVPINLLNRASDSLGRFVGDEGWGQHDMDTADDLYALLVAPTAPAPQDAQVGKDALTSEQRHALKEGERNAVTEKYFRARAWINDTSANRCTFEAGFDRGYEAARAVLAGESGVKAEQECDIPPFGWRCTRPAGHSGPCAAVEAPEDVSLVERGMARYRAGVVAQAQTCRRAAPSDAEIEAFAQNAEVNGWGTPQIKTFARALLERYGNHE